MINDTRLGCGTSKSRPIRVLHVDDEPADLEITRIFLGRIGKNEFEIVSVLSAEEALAELERDDFDAIIADYQMPGMDGIEFLEVVRKSGRYADTPFILFTGKGGVEVAAEALKKGADRCITKNGNPATQCGELARSIQELVKGGGGGERESLWIGDKFHTKGISLSS
ncbi:MAG: response regulator [Candidatus Methanospirareceae archaeon]